MFILRFDWVTSIETSEWFLEVKELPWLIKFNFGKKYNPLMSRAVYFNDSKIAKATWHHGVPPCSLFYVDEEGIQASCANFIRFQLGLMEDEFLRDYCLLRLGTVTCIIVRGKSSRGFTVFDIYSDVKGSAYSHRQRMALETKPIRRWSKCRIAQRCFMIGSITVSDTGDRLACFLYNLNNQNISYVLSAVVADRVYNDIESTHQYKTVSIDYKK